MPGFENPVPGDEVLEVCINRQTARNVPTQTAKQVCQLMSTVLQANGLQEDSDFVLVPAVFTKEGVHNGSFKPWEAIRNAAATLVGTPFFVNQPGEHEPGKWPPVDDQTRWHGVVAQVDVDETGRQLSGLIALFKPDAMRANGANDQRIRFQETLLKAAELGGRFAISVAFGARLRAEEGVFRDVPYQAVEEKLVFNSVSLVPRGAESTAVMNGYMGAPDSRTESLPDDSLYSDNGEREAPTMPGDAETAWVRDASLSKLKELSPEVNRLAAESDKKATEVAGLREQHETLKAEVNKAKQTTDDLVKVLANAIETDAAKAEALATSTKPLVLATNVARELEELKTKVNTYLQAEQKALRGRCEKALKVLANVFSKDKIALFYDEKDLVSSANRLETLAEAYSPGEIVPDLDPEANEDHAGDDATTTENRAFAAAERLSRETGRGLYPEEDEN